jgi:hypothetical protein
METAGSPTFLGNQNRALAVLFDPGGTVAPGHLDATVLPPN